MITIAKTFTFDSAHHIPTMPEGHKCRGMHGHSYSATLELCGDPGPRGFFVDYEEIAIAWNAYVHCLVDHRVLNEITGLEVPTTEVLAKWAYARLLHPDSRIRDYLVAVRIAESHTTWAEYRVPLPPSNWSKSS